MPDLNGLHLSQYEITALPGEGGRAAVYRARQTSIKRDVAVRVIKRFGRQAETVASRSHPRIVIVFDICHHYHYYPRN